MTIDKNNRCLRVNTFINRAIDETMERDNSATGVNDDEI